MRTTRKSGFTLVELLVVIGIIGLLISILLPAMSRAKAEAKRAVCLSNLRTLGQCFAEYVNDSKGKGLFNLYIQLPAPSGFSNYTEYWFASLTKVTGGNYVWDVKQGYLSKYFRNPSFLSCPAASEYFSSFSSTSTNATIQTMWDKSPLTTYAFNGNATMAWRIPGASGPPYPTYVLKGVSGIKNSTETCALVDGIDIDNTGSVTGALKSISPYLTEDGIFNNKTPSFHGRHVGKGNVLWYDGHASSQAPYITTLSSNLTGGWSSANGKAIISKFKIGFLTPSSEPETTAFANMGTANNFSYYYWVDKTAQR